MPDADHMSVAFIAVGSNVEPHGNIAAALAMLLRSVSVRASSTFYRTKPIGGRDQPPFVNGVWRISTDLRPLEIKHAVLSPIEDQLGRVRGDDKYADRTIDLDLVLYDDFVTDDPELTLPHPDVSRPFVHGPILELLDDARAEIEPELLASIRRLLPDRELTALPGEPLADFTAELQRLLG